jgi:hypothetical protein
MTDQAITELTPVVGTKAACAALGRPRATHYRWHRQSPPPARVHAEPKPQPRALSATERTQAVHPARVKPELVAHGPNECWSRVLKTRVAHGYCSRTPAAGACPYANICEQ